MDRSSRTSRSNLRKLPTRGGRGQEGEGGVERGRTTADVEEQDVRSCWRLYTGQRGEGRDRSATPQAPCLCSLDPLVGIDLLVVVLLRQERAKVLPKPGLQQGGEVRPAAGGDPWLPSRPDGNAQRTAGTFACSSTPQLSSDQCKHVTRAACPEPSAPTVQTSKARTPAAAPAAASVLLCPRR